MSTAIDWKALDADIYRGLDIKAEAEALGVRFAGNEPNGSGWLSCHAIDREDANPSAAVCVRDVDGNLGRYTDLGGKGEGGGKSISLYDLRVKAGQACDFREARAYYAAKAGVVLPAGKGRKPAPKTLQETIAAQLLITATGADSDLVRFKAHELAASRPGVTAEAILACNPSVGFWPNASKDRLLVVAFNCHSPADWSTPCAVLLYRTNGQAFPPAGLIGERKAHLLKNSVDGLILVGGRAALEASHTVWLCEGLPDALALHPLLPAGHVAVTASHGASSFRHGLTKAFEGKRVRIICDRDMAGDCGTKLRVQALTPASVGALEVKAIELPYPLAEKHGRDLRDWICDGNGFEQLQKLTDATPPSRIGRPDIEITTDEYEVNNAALEALAADPMLFKRGGSLVTISEASGDDGARPTIVNMPREVLRETVAQHATFYRASTDGEERTPAHVPDWCYKAIHARSEWCGIRPLAGIATSPVLRADGTVLATPGYDPQTQLFLADSGAGVTVPERPSRDDARAAIAALLDVVCDFPFEKREHQSSWLSLVLTPLARHAFSGPAPLHLVDGNVRGVGKSLAVDLPSIIIQGRPAARMTNPRDDEEARKAITSAALAGHPLNLIDNVVGALGCASLDAALTGTIWQDRMLGSNELVELPLLATWAATGNNVVLRADTSRRVLHIRLQSPLETPETRTGFKYPNVRAHVTEQRRELLSAALTVMRAYFVAGRPKHDLPAWGSFESWSDLVRQALVWVGQPDPAATRQELVEAGDREFLALRTMLETWGSVDSQGAGLSAAELLEAIKGDVDDGRAAFREALLELCPPAGTAPAPSAHQLGRKLAIVRGRVVGGHAIDYREARGRRRLWRVVDVSAPVAILAQEKSPMSPSGLFGDGDANDDILPSVGGSQKEIGVLNDESINTSKGTGCHQTHLNHHADLGRQIVPVPPCERCGGCSAVDVLLPDERGVRRDCASCGRTIGFPNWTPTNGHAAAPAV